MKNIRTIAILFVTLVILLVAFADLNFQSVALLSAANQSSQINPVGSVERLISNSFPFSSQLSQFRTILELYSGKKNVNGVFILKNRLIARQPTTNVNIMQRNLQFIQEFSLNTANKYLMVIPSAAEIYSSQLPNTGESAERKLTVKSLYENVEGNLTKVDVSSAFYIVRDEYIYYNTDRNLTSLGGYYLYKSIGNKMGFQVLARDSFDIHYSTRDFHGSLCSQASYYGVPSDTVSSYTFSDAPQLSNIKVVAENAEKTGSGIDFLNEQLFANDSIDDTFFCVEIDTNLPSGQNLLIFTNGIGKAVIPYLSLHYKHITVIDSNCPAKVYQQIKTVNYDQVLFAVDMDQFVSKNIYANFSG